MRVFEVIIFIAAYSTILLTIFVSLICYRRKIERWETVAFFASVLFLIVALTAPAIYDESGKIENVNIFVLLAMITISLTTPMNILSERHHNVSSLWKKIIIAIPILMFVLTVIAYFMDKIEFIEPLVVILLGVSIVSSMVFVWFTKPNKKSKSLEKIGVVFSVVFFILVPLALMADFVLPGMGYEFRVDFTLPLAFLLMAIYKLMDDLNRLSLFKNKVEPNEQHFINYQISDREKEITLLLLKGNTYKEISEELFISMSTVKTHASNIYKKCGVKSRNELNYLFNS